MAVLLSMHSLSRTVSLDMKYLMVHTHGGSLCDPDVLLTPGPEEQRTLTAAAGGRDRRDAVPPGGIQGKPHYIIATDHQTKV